MRRVLLGLMLLTVLSCAGEGSEATAILPSTATIGSETPASNSSITGPEWAMPGIEFLDALSSATRGGDTEMMLAFYHPDARLVVTDDGQGLATGWRQISDAIGRLPHAEPDLVLIGFDFAATVSQGGPECVDADCDTVWVNLYRIWDGAIGLHLRADRADPDSSAGLYSLYVDSATSYTEHDLEGMRRFYSDAVFAPGFPVEEYETLFESFPTLAAAPMTLDELGLGATSHPALFDLGTTGTSPRGTAGLGVYTITFTPTVETVAASLWRLWDGAILEAGTLFDPTGWDRMLGAAGLEPPSSWFSYVEVPEPRAVEKTHEISLGDGVTTEVFNASDRSVDLIEWAIGRFGAVGLSPPHVHGIYMESERSCLEESAWTFLSETTADIRICLSDDEIAGDDGLSVTSRITMLHELGHVWAAEHLSEEDREAFLADRGLDTWNDGSVPWSDRGAEHAAEIIAWGLSDRPFDVVRIGDSSCGDLVAAFRSLTGSDPAHDC